jgi:hypothetical protein
MFLSCNILIALVDVPCKSDHHIVRLKHCVRVCIPMATIMLQSRNIGQQGREEGKDKMTRKEWDGSRGVEGAEASRVQDRGDLLGETCSARRSRVVEGERCQEGLLSTEKWVSNREFGSLKQRRDGREWVKQSWEVTAILKEIRNCTFVMAMSGAGRK